MPWPAAGRRASGADFGCELRIATVKGTFRVLGACRIGRNSPRKMAKRVPLPSAG
jgi:hypothetical protein